MENARGLIAEEIKKKRGRIHGKFHRSAPAFQLLENVGEEASFEPEIVGRKGKLCPDCGQRGRACSCPR